MRVIDEEGKQIGVIPTAEAQQLAKDKELDLVEIAPEAKPPVVKITDFAKFQYLEEKKQKEARKKTKETEVKEVRFSPFIGEHDKDTNLKKIRKFLKDGDLVKITIVFKGRQMGHTEFGPKLLQRIMAELGGIAQQDREARFEGRRFSTVIKPTKGAQLNDEEEKTGTHNQIAETNNEQQESDEDNIQNAGLELLTKNQNKEP